MFECRLMLAFPKNAGLFVAAIVAAGCSDTSKSAVDDSGAEAAAPLSDAASGDASAADAVGGDAAEDSGPPGPFTGNCSSSRWASVSEACCSCFCSTCKDSINACDLECI